MTENNVFDSRYFFKLISTNSSPLWMKSFSVLKLLSLYSYTSYSVLVANTIMENTILYQALFILLFLNFFNLFLELGILIKQNYLTWWVYTSSTYPSLLNYCFRNKNICKLILKLFYKLLFTNIHCFMELL